MQRPLPLPLLLFFQTSYALVATNRGIVDSLGGAAHDDPLWINLLTVPEIANLHPQLTLLGKLYDATEFTFKLEQSRHVTVLMPENNAVQKSGILAALGTMDYDDVQTLFNTHIIPEVFKADEAKDGVYPFVTASGEEIEFRVSRAMPGAVERRDSTHLRAKENSGLLLPDDYNEGDEEEEEESNSSDAADSLYSNPATTPPHVDILLQGRKIAAAQSGATDNANGVSYIVDALLLTEEMKAKIEAAGGSAESTVNLRADLPDYIDITNKRHWFYGRIGGVPGNEVMDDTTLEMKKEIESYTF